MPGRSAEGGPWGELPLVIDTSAWARVGDPRFSTTTGDYDRLAEVMEFESAWLAPAGTLP